MEMGYKIIICITIGLTGLLDIIYDMHCFKGGWDCAGAFAADLPRPSQSSGHKLFKYMHGSSEFGMGQRYVWQLFYVFDRPGQIIQHDQWYFVSVSRPGQLWISHNVEYGCKMKRIHDWGSDMNCPKSGFEALEHKNSACDDGVTGHFEFLFSRGPGIRIK